jgi:hypothetical protein
MDMLDGVDRVEQVGLARAGSGATHINPADRALLAQDHSAAGRAARIGEMSDFDTGDFGDRAALILGKSIRTDDRFPLINDCERGRGETASQNVTSRCFPHKSSHAEVFGAKVDCAERKPIPPQKHKAGHKKHKADGAERLKTQEYLCLLCSALCFCGEAGLLAFRSINRRA